MYRSVKPLASRVVAKFSLEPSSKEQLRDYLQHHLGIAGVKKFLYEDSALIAIHSESRDFYRKANHLARGALIAAAQKTELVTEEHVRLASTELI